MGGQPTAYGTDTVRLTPTQAFDTLYRRIAPALVRQTYLLSGQPEFARESVERAFQLAWQHWSEVTTDREPAGWVRAAAHEHALSPWHRLRPSLRWYVPPADPEHRLLLAVLLELPPAHRRTLLLHDGLGFDLADTAAETEASTPTTANRLLHARRTLAGRLRQPALPSELRRRMTALAAAAELQTRDPAAVRADGEGRTRFWTRATVAFTSLIAGATAVTLCVAPDHYEPDQVPGAAVTGLPSAPPAGPLSAQQSTLRALLEAQAHSGPQRLVPEAR